MSTDVEVSESDSDTEYMVDTSIIRLRDKIIERKTVYNYLKVCLNTCHIVENHLLEDSPRYQKIALGCMILDSIPELRQMQQFNHSMLENLYQLAEHPNRLNIMRKKIGWFQWCMRWLH